MRDFITGLAGFAATASCLVVLALPASAADAPNLVGTWKGGTQAVHIGPNPYRLPDGNNPTFGDTVLDFTYVIDKQEGTRFSGHTEGKFVETIIGALKPPAFDSGVFLDDDGTYDFTMRDANTIDLCYSHLYPTSKVVACWTLERQP
ncbi:MAG: hypothetical protein J0H08_14545 [Rhizobiales bacterium]|nr:hypothetical protein [Hyphomicrobiales bacterium]